MNIGDQLTGRVKKIRTEECLWDSETGYSPQNTNTPSRFGQFNVANLNSPYGCSLSDLQPSPPNDPEITFSDMGEVIGPESMYVYDSCNKVSRMMGAESWRNYITDEEDIKDEKGNVIGKKYTVKINNEEIIVKQINGGMPVAETIGYWYLNPKAAAIVKGLNEGFMDMQDRGIDWSKINVRNLLNDVANFTSNNLEKWRQIYAGEDANEELSTFLKHATVGGGIKQYMRQDQRPNTNDTGQYDMMIGFWTSYYVSAQESPELGGERKKWFSEIHYNKDGSINMNTTKPGIVDIARISKAIMTYEHRDNILDPNAETKNYNKDGSYASSDWGLMQVNDDIFSKRVTEDIIGYFSNIKKISSVNWKTDPFFNIGAGVGSLFDTYSQNAKTNTLTYWYKAIKGYNGDGDDADKYVERCFNDHFLPNFGKIPNKPPW